jgi:hypothetical protein
MKHCDGQKITLGEMRSSAIKVHAPCRDGRRPLALHDVVRLSDLEPLFTCKDLR